MFLIRQARPGDHRQLLKLARELDSINLPTQAPELREMLARSARSFKGLVHDRSRAVYVFCAEDIGTRRLAGASMIIAKHGTPQSPHYYLEMDSDERYSPSLGKMFRHTYLRLRYSMDGPTEVGGLIVKRAMRRHPERVGKQLSWVRFLYLAMHRARFEKRVIAEMLPPLTPGYSNAFWDHYGGRVTGLTFREADRLSIRDKQFIRELFPESPLYTFLLPDHVRDSLGETGEEARGAVRLLEQAGMRFLHHIDPFDGGPYYGAAIADLEPVRNYRRLRVVKGGNSEAAERGGNPRRYMIAREDEAGFRAVMADALADGGRLAVAPQILKLLKVREGDRVETTTAP
jgi:arginine N-succinyltransferase